MEAALQCFLCHWDVQALQEEFWQRVSCSPTDVGVRAMVQTWQRLSEVLRKSCR